MPILSVSKEKFYELDIYTEKSQFRYRIITDDKNYSSYWSPIYSISPEIIFFRGAPPSTGALSLEKHTEYVSASWDAVLLYDKADGISNEGLIGQLPYYDVWVQFSGESGINPGDWQYKERIYSTSYNVIIPSQYEYGSGSLAVPDRVNVEIYRPGRPIKRYKKNDYSIDQDSESVNVGSDSVSTSTPNDLSHGDSVLYLSESPIGGLTSDTLYFAAVLSENSFTLHSNQKDALSGQNKINLTSTGSGVGYFEQYPFLLYKGTSTATPGLLVLDGGQI